MSKSSVPTILARKTPKQARSQDLIEAVLEAAIQVLAKEGAHRFTTARVAEKAGVSVGSLYQYFPNKASILFRLQSEEWRRTSALLLGIVNEESLPPMQRLRQLVQAFLQSECEEAELRQALADAAPLYRDAPEARDRHDEGEHSFKAFLRRLLPEVPRRARILAAELITNSLSVTAKQFSERPRSGKEIREYADAMADMFCAYVEQLNGEALWVRQASK